MPAFSTKFIFSDSAHPTDSFVRYQSYDAAKGLLIKGTARNARMMVDSGHMAASGCASVRLMNKGLISLVDSLSISTTRPPVCAVPGRRC